MASVRLSRDLRRDILHKSQVAFEKTNPDPKPPTAFLQKLTAAIANSPMQKTAMKMRQCHADERGVIQQYKSFGMKDLMPQILNLSTFNLKGRYRNAEEKNLTTSNYNSDVFLEFNVEMRAPVMVYHSPDRYVTDFSQVALYVSDFDESDQQPILDGLVMLIEQRETLREKRMGYRQNIQQLLEDCNTVHQFVETWPAGDAFLSTEVKQRMHEKVTRQQSARNRREALNFDSTIANQVVLTSKLIGV
jgi:hypothetical protein